MVGVNIKRTKKGVPPFKWNKTKAYFERFTISKPVKPNVVDKFVKKYLEKNKNRDQYLYSINAFYPEANTSRMSQWRTWDTVQTMEDYIMDSIGNLALTVTEFDLLYRKKPAGGSDDDKNDCLWDCLCSGYGGKLNMPRCIRKKSDLKKLLELERTEEVCVYRLKILESKLNISFSVYGDCDYVSEEVMPINFNLLLKDNHYSLKHNEGRQNSKYIAFKPVPKENVYTYCFVDSSVYYCDGTWQLVLSRDEWINKFKNYSYLNIKCDSGSHANNELFKQRREFVEKADELLKISNGKINYYKCQYSGHLAMDIWRQMSKYVAEPEPLSNLEHRVCDQANRGGFHYFKQGTYKHCYDIDMNAMYSYYMSHSLFMIPVKEGKQGIITTEQFDEFKFFPFGLYYCNITGTHIFANKKLLNKNMWFTHYSLSMFKLLGLTIKIVDSGCINSILYDSHSRINGNKMFKSYVDYMYSLRIEHDNKDVKKLMSALWGAHSQKNTKKDYVKYGDCADMSGRVIDGIDHSHSHDVIESTDSIEIFKTNYGRLGSFISSYCQFKIVEFIISNVTDLDRVIAVNTDGITTIGPVDNINLSNKLGEWKCKYSDKTCVINSDNSVIFS